MKLLKCQPHRIIHIITQLLITITPILLAIAVIFYSYDLYRHGNQEHYIAWFSAGGFVLITFPVSVYLIIQHLTHWYMPNVQKYVVRIVGMIPIYSIESWFSLRFRGVALYIETIRECYEAYVIYSFLYFLIALLGDEIKLTTILRSKPKDRLEHHYPFNYIFTSWDNPIIYLHNCKLGVFQYVLIKNICSIIIIVLEKNHLYHEGYLSFTGGYLYICLISTISQLWALYCLSMFYLTFKEELTPWKPVGKFLSVKLVIFFTWWQSVMINIACNRRWIRDKEGGWTLNEINKGFQDYLICIEMFIAAVAFNFTFSYKDYLLKNNNQKKKDLYIEPDPLHKNNKSNNNIYGDDELEINRLNIMSDNHNSNINININNNNSNNGTNMTNNNNNNSNLYLHMDTLKSSNDNLQLNFTDNEEIYEEVQVNKPFLSALWQSSLPDDIMADIRKFTIFNTSPTFISKSDVASSSNEEMISLTEINEGFDENEQNSR